MLYEPTPIERTPQPSAYDHLSPNTNLAPRRKATVWMPPTLATDVAAQTSATSRSRIRPASCFVAITVIIMLLAALRPLLASPEQLLGQTLATAPTFSVALPDGSSQLLQDPSMVLRIALSTTETFTVWASPTSAVEPRDAEIAQRAAAGMSGSRTAVTDHLDGALSVGTRVGEPPVEQTTQRSRTRYVIDDTAIVTTSSFGTMAASWRWS